MGRIRTIKPEFWIDDLVGSLKRESRLLFIAMLNFADDEGLLPWSAPFLKGAAFPFDEDLSVSDVAGFMEELANSKMVFPYRAGRSQQSLGYIVNFHKHQKRNRPTPSKLSPPSLQTLEVRQMYCHRDLGRCHICGGVIDTPTLDAPEDFCLSMDHIIPISKGGTDHPSNIKSAHMTCNKGRRDRTVEEHRESIRQKKTRGSVYYPDRFNEIPEDRLDEDALSGSGGDSVSESMSGSRQEGKGKEQGKEQEGKTPAARGAGDGALFPVGLKDEPVEITPTMVASAVLDEAQLSGRDLRVVLEDICRKAMKAGMSADELRAAMVSAWIDYDKSRPILDFPCGAAKFFGEGLWRNRAGWKYKTGHAPPLKANRVPDAYELQMAEDAARMRRKEGVCNDAVTARA
jgi:5-methylcytosine-specific restriction endonuclease McrA